MRVPNSTRLGSLSPTMSSVSTPLGSRTTAGVAVRHAKSAARLGVDMISMDGFECVGGLRFADVSTFCCVFFVLTSALSAGGMVGGACVLLSQHSCAPSDAPSLEGVRFSQLLAFPFHSRRAGTHQYLDDVTPCWHTPVP